MKRFLGALAVALAVFPVHAQLITGSIAGTVVDPAALAVAGANITLVQTATGLERRATTNQQGDFVFTGLEAGEYNLTVASSGFKKYEKRGLILSTGDHLSAGTLALDVGAVSETISVTAERGAAVETQSAERADVISSRQVDQILIRGRNVTSLVELLPGVVLTNEQPSLDRDTQFSVMGNRTTTNNVSIDGLPVIDIDNGFSMKLTVSQDAVSEVKILLSNYQAEYGRNAGSNVHVVTKSGARDFHGMGSYFKRHEQFNANNFFNNQNGIAKPRYRFNTWSYNLGGPIYIPNKFNRDRNKLFFFWSQEYWPTKTSTSGRVTMPTALERTGDFSQSFDLGNKLIAVKDPATGLPFPGNVIPASRLDPNGQAMLKVFDLPNFFNRDISKGNYNYVFTSENNVPRLTNTLKIDYNLNSDNQFSASYSMFNETSEGAVGTTGTSANWPQLRMRFWAPNKGTGVRYTRIFSPTLINEFHFGWLKNPEIHTYTQDQLERNQRSALGFNTGQFNTSINPLGLIPNTTWGGVTSPANTSINGRFPANNQYNIFNWDDKVTWIHGSHVVKTGIYLERAYRDVNQGVAFNGAIDFGRNVNNPLDTGYAYANAALGVFNSYSEPSARPRMFSRGHDMELFLQDTWKVTSRLTLDYGLRFYWMPPIWDANDALSGFSADQFNPAARVSLIQPGFDANGKRAGISPVNGAVYPATMIGAIAPGAGNPANGMVVASQNPNYPKALAENRGIQLGPRFGFAYDPFGKGRTAIRGGFGMFYNRESMSDSLPFVAYQPLVQTPIINFGTLSNLLSSSGLLYPTNVGAFDRNSKTPMVMNYSFSVQQDVGHGTVVDVGYVGALGRHLIWQRDLNAIPLGSNFNPANADPTNKSPLPAPFLRPYTGYNNINIIEGASSSNYHSLQVTANRRFTHGLQFGAAWTWSKAMDFNSSDKNSVSALVPVRVWDYGLSTFDRTHIVKLNFLWDLPKVPWKFAPATWVLNNWQLSGITTFQSGQPLGVGFATTVAMDITGTSSQGARPVVTGNPVLSKGDRTFYRNFDTSVFHMPAKGTVGNEAKTSIRGPGINNWDIAVFKNFPIREAMRMQFRAEFYNAFNHTQFSALDTTARFDPAGNQTNGRFGQFTGARDPRQVQLALRFYF